MFSARSHFFFAYLLALAVGFVITTSATAQTNSASAECGMPRGLLSVTGHNLFTEQQEEWLGEVMEKEIRSDFNVIDDPDNYLQKVADRLQAQLPPSNTHYRFLIIDSPELNSFGLVGGRIFIHRRMIAFTHNEDELATLLGHEMGHMVDHHLALRMSDFFRQMGVSSLGDRADVLKHWKEFEDIASKIKHRNDEQRDAEEQVIADRIAFYALVRAGYDPEKGIAFADRLLETKGKMGNFWSDFAGTTNPNAKRFREMLKSERPLAQNCIAKRPPEAGEFAAWQKNIIASTKSATLAKADLPGLMRKVTLQSQLRSDLFSIEFSPDGKYFLSQDQSSILVAAREPLANLFRIDAFDAHNARFSPDSRSVVFYDKELRIEKWDVASGKRTSINQLTIPECYQSELSPNGNYLGCIDEEFGLKLVEVATNTVLLERKQFYRFSNYFDWYRYYLARLADDHIRIFDMKFSPDERYFIAGHFDSFAAYDLKERIEAKLSWRIHELGRLSFAFAGPDEFDGLRYAGPNDMRLVRLRFPSGEKLDEFKVQADGWLSSSQNRDALLMRPAAAYPVGIIDLTSKKITQAFMNPAFAVYGGIYAGEQNSGEVALFSTADSKMIGKLKLPESLLGRARTSVFSPDGKWLAVSQGSRGSLWNLENGQRVFLARGFNGALFENDQLITEFAQDPPNPPRVFQFDLHGSSNNGSSNTRLYNVPAGAFLHTHSWQWGNLLVTMHPENEKEDLGRGRTILQVHDVHNNYVLWERRLHQGLPGVFYTPTAITMLIWDWGGIKEAAKEDESINARLAKLENKDTSYLLEAFEPKTGKLLGSVLVDTGKLSFRVSAGYAAGDKMFVTDGTNHRTLIYSIKTGAQQGSLIGQPVAATPNGDRVLVQNESGTADLYDTATQQSVEHFNFSARIVDADFARDGSLYVLTADQNVYQLNVSKEQQRAAQ
jgi:WD40 repeat protein